MTRIYSGTATVTNNDATVIITSGAPLTSANCPADAPIALNGVTYYVASRTDTTHLELTRNYAGTTGAVAVEIDPLTPDALSVVNVAVLVARVQAQLNVLDKNSQGLFYNRVGVTGDADPAPGNLAFDDSDPTAVTEFYIDNIDANQRPVTGLLDLWSAGTTVLIRSLATTAYVAYRLPSGVSVQSGYYKAETQYVDHDGVLADGEAVSIGWFRVGEGLSIDASGTLAGRAAYDGASAGFVYAADSGSLYRKNSATSADWGPAIPIKGAAGDRGWAPRFAVVADGARRVMQLAGYVGGTGTAPTSNVGQYVSTGGYAATIASATDIRGGIGLSAFEVAVLAGFSGDEEDWLASLVGLSAYEMALANGFVGDAASWLASLRGDDGNDPGIFLIWDDGTADGNPGAGTLRANNALATSATFLYVSKINRPGNDISVFLSTLAASNSNRKGVITISLSGGGAQATFDVTGITDAVGYVKVAVTNGSGATFADNDIVSFQFSPAGDRGTDGLGAGNFITESEPEIDPTGKLVAFSDDSGTAGENSGIAAADILLKTNNGSDFSSKKATLDNLHLKAADVASAVTMDLEAATGSFVNVTGTTATTAITLTSGHQRLVRAAGAWPITVGANLVLNTGGASYTCAAGDLILFVADGAVVRGTVFPVSGQPASRVTNAKLAQVATGTMKGRATAGTGDLEDLTTAQARTLLGIADGNKGDVTVSGDGWTVPALAGSRQASPFGLSGMRPLVGEFEDAHYGFNSGILDAGNGKWVFVYRKGATHSLVNNSEIRAFDSYDKGATRVNDRLLFKNSTYDTRNFVSGLMGGGRMGVLCVRRGETIGYQDAVLLYSDDAGVTWLTKSIPLPSTGFSYNFHGYLHPYPAAVGGHDTNGYIAYCYGQGANAVISAVYTLNNGVTWTWVTGIANPVAPVTAFSEMSVSRIGTQNKWLMYVRQEGGAEDRPALVFKSTNMLTWSAQAYAGLPLGGNPPITIYDPATSKFWLIAFVRNNHVINGLRNHMVGASIDGDALWNANGVFSAGWTTMSAIPNWATGYLFPSFIGGKWYGTFVCAEDTQSHDSNMLCLIGDFLATSAENLSMSFLFFRQEEAIETNANGSYVKLHNGLMICWGRHLGVAVTTAASNQFGSTAGTTYFASITVNLPADFPDATYTANADADERGVVKLAGSGRTVGSFQVQTHHNSSGSLVPFQWQAVGRWK